MPRHQTSTGLPRGQTVQFPPTVGEATYVYSVGPPLVSRVTIKTREHVCPAGKVPIFTGTPAAPGVPIDQSQMIQTQPNARTIYQDYHAALPIGSYFIAAGCPQLRTQAGGAVYHMEFQFGVAPAFTNHADDGTPGPWVTHPFSAGPAVTLPTAGGGQYCVHGTGFEGATSVKIDGVAVMFLVEPGNNYIDFTPAAHAAGTVNLVVTTPAGTATLPVTFA
jgi:hypothetical protein